MAKFERFEDLPIWQEAVSLGVAVYRLTSNGVLAKDYSVKDQLRRAVISISNNIAEGFEYNNNKSFITFLRYAKGSAGELRSNLYVLTESSMIHNNEYDELYPKLVTLSQNIKGFINYLNKFESKTKGI